MKVKSYFISRFPDGKIINADLKQIEVILFAQLCKDKNLTDLLKEGQDIHRFIGTYVLEKPEEEITDTERSDIKKCVFGIIYGNGANKLSINTGRDVVWCKEFIQTFYKLFPNAKIWHNYILQKVEKIGYMTTIFGQLLKFKKYPAEFDWQKRKGIVESYNPPDIKNWPVQSSAHVVMSLLLGQFWRQKVQYKRDKYLMINTVHDSFMLDCQEEYVEEAIKDIQEVVDKLPEIIYDRFKVRMVVPIKIDIRAGFSWGDLK